MSASGAVHLDMSAGGAGASGRLVQYVVVRSDLVHQLSWPLGAVITQACHAATAAVHLFYTDPDTQRYLQELDSMHKVVLAVSAAPNPGPTSHHSPRHPHHVTATIPRGQSHARLCQCRCSAAFNGSIELI